MGLCNTSTENCVYGLGIEALVLVLYHAVLVSVLVNAVFVAVLVLDHTVLVSVLVLDHAVLVLDHAVLVSVLVLNFWSCAHHWYNGSNICDQAAIRKIHRKEQDSI